MRIKGRQRKVRSYVECWPFTNGGLAMRPTAPGDVKGPNAKELINAESQQPAPRTYCSFRMSGFDKRSFAGSISEFQMAAPVFRELQESRLQDIVVAW